MGKNAHTKRVLLQLTGGATAALLIAGCGGSSPVESSGDPSSGSGVTLEFAQWWEPELPDGFLRGLMDDFEAANPGIQVELLSGPYASTKEQLFAGAAAGTMSDVVGLDGAWVSDFAEQGATTDLSALMAEAATTRASSPARSRSVTPRT